MATMATLRRVQAMAWTLIYGGLLTLVLGLATHRLDAGQGEALMTGGAVAASAGVCLIFIRSRLKETP